MSYLDLTIVEMHAALINKLVTPLELAIEAIQRAKKDNNNAIETLMEKEALAIASQLITPEKENVLWGIPFAIKDNISTKDILTTASSNILKDYVPVFNATVVERLLALHAVPICKTALDELAMGGTGTTGHLGSTFNPYDETHERLVGGSSSGSAAVVAASIVPFALGTDTGDSIRKPASFAGLVGLKPTWGRISRYGVFPFAPSLDHVGFFTRSVEDSAILLNALAGRDLKDSSSSNVAIEDYSKLLNDDIKGIRLAYVKEIVESIKEERTKQSFEKLLLALKAKGAIINPVSIDTKILETFYPTYMVISCAEVTSNNANLDGVRFGPRPEGQSYQEIMFKARSTGFGELIKRRFVIGSYALKRENQDLLFLRAQKNRHMIVDKFNDILKTNDLIIAPAAPGIAPRFNETTDRLSNDFLIADNHLVIGNFAGLPSITVPTDLVDMMPLGVNIMGRSFAESTVFKLANQIEKITNNYNLSAKKVKL